MLSLEADNTNISIMALVTEAKNYKQHPGRN
jgi:hypothetical protein